MEHSVAEPIGKVGRFAAFIFRWRRLRLALRRTGGAGDANMEMIIVAIHRPDLPEPAPIALGLAAQRLLDRRIDEDTLHSWFLRGVPDHGEMARRPDFRIDVEAVGTHHHDGGHVLALLTRQTM